MKMYIMLYYMLLGHIETVCNNNDNTTSDDHVINGINTLVVNSKNSTSINNVDVVNNNESPKIGEKNDKKDKGVDKTDKDTKMNDISHSEDSSEENTDNEKKQDAEIIFIQDLGFNVKIVCPGTEAFEIQVCLIKHNYYIYIYILMYNNNKIV